MKIASQVKLAATVFIGIVWRTVACLRGKPGHVDGEIGGLAACFVSVLLALIDAPAAAEFDCIIERHPIAAVVAVAEELDFLKAADLTSVELVRLICAASGSRGIVYLTAAAELRLRIVGSCATALCLATVASLKGALAARQDALLRYVDLSCAALLIVTREDGVDQRLAAALNTQLVYLFPSAAPALR